MAASVSEDAIAEILSYLPLKAATRLKTVCRSWHQLISAPYFRSLALLQRRASDVVVLGFFQYSLCDWRRLQLARLPDHRLKPTDRRLDGHNRIHILAVCDGIMFAVAPNMTQYYVWNPSSGGTGIFRCIPKPPPSPLPAQYNSYGLAKDSHGGSFKIVNLVPNGLPHWLHGYSTWIYSSKRGTWERFDWELPPRNICISLIRNPTGAACARRSILHWLIERRMIIAFDSTTQRYRQMNLPSGIGYSSNVIAWLGSVDGELYILVVTGRKAVELWVLQNYDEVHWMKVMEVECPSIISAPVFFDGERIAVVVLVRNGGKRLIFHNTRSRRWEGAQHISHYDPSPCFIPFIRDETRFI